MSLAWHAGDGTLAGAGVVAAMEPSAVGIVLAFGAAVAGAECVKAEVAVAAVSRELFGDGDESTDERDDSSTTSSSTKARKSALQRVQSIAAAPRAIARRLSKSKMSI